MEIKERLQIAIKELKARQKTFAKSSQDYANCEECIDKLKYLAKNIKLLGDIKTCSIVHFDNYDDEVWKPITIADEGVYEVSNKMRIRNISTNKILKPFLNDGYNYICLMCGGKVRHIGLNRVVASAFIPNPENKKYVDHINANSLDDRPENLRWVTQKENMSNIHTVENMTGNHGQPVLQYNFKGEFVKEWVSAFAASRAYKWNNSATIIIARCCKKYGYMKTYKGFIWKFKKDVPQEKIHMKLEDLDYYITSRSKIKAVLQFTEDNIFVAEYKSANYAAKSLGFPSSNGISKCCNGKIDNFKGYIWKWKSDLSK